MVTAHPSAAPGIVTERLEEQIAWYDGRSRSAKAWYLRLKVVQIVTAAAIPVLAAADLPVWVAGALGAIVLVIESIQQLLQLHSSWIQYRSTAEALKHEKFLFLARAGLYAAAEAPERVLARRVESLVSRENSAWASAQHDRAARDAQAQAAGPSAG